MERVGVILAVRHAGNAAIALFIHADEAAGKPLGGRGQQGEVHVHGLAFCIAELAHVAHNGKALLLHLIAFTVVVAIQRRQRLGKAD